MYVLSGRGYAASEAARRWTKGQLAVFGAGDALRSAPLTRSRWRRRPAGRCWCSAACPIREPVARYGPFVMNTRDEIMQALKDFHEGRMGRIPATRVPHRTAADQAVERA